MNELDKLLKLVRHLIIGFIWSFLLLLVLIFLVSVFFFQF